jgi:hypothetical protein
LVPRAIRVSQLDLQVPDAQEDPGEDDAQDDGPGDGERVPASPSPFLSA